MGQEQTKELLLEIGTEELPSEAMEGIRGCLPSLAQELFISQGISPDADLKNTLFVYLTPRRIVLHCKEVPARQGDSEVQGPPRKIAFDDAGKPTDVLKKFLEKRGLDIKDVKDADGERVVINKPGRDTVDVLKELLPELITKLQFKKSMRWDDSGFRFSRPVRWLLAVLGEDIVKFSVGGVGSGDVTYVNRNISSEAIAVKSIDQYFRQVEKGFVIIDSNKRRLRIEDEFKKLANEKNASPPLTGQSGGPINNLLNEVVNLVEYPTAFSGSFSPDFLKLPSEILMASMAKNQRVFCLYDKEGKLLPHFLAVSNTPKGDIKLIRRNYERVLNAKLKDALFFYEADKRTALKKRAESLKDVVFFRGLGSMYDKCARTAKLAKIIAEEIGAEACSEKAARICELSKADLTSLIVGEFPTLQGVAGKYFARNDGEEDDVADGIAEHYLPRFAGDDLPESDAGTIAALADKIDSLAAFFAIGHIPSSTKDPYALRRQAIGVCNILKDKKEIKDPTIHLKLRKIFDKALSEIPEPDLTGKKKKAPQDKESVINSLMKFMRERFVNLIKDVARYDIIEAVLASGFDDVYDANKRIFELNAIAEKDYFEKARTIAERTHNIVRAVKISYDELEKEVKEDLLVEDSEKRLWEQYNASVSGIEDLIDSGNYQKATEMYAEAFYEVLHTFFDKVLVNVDDERLKINRLTIIRKVNTLYGSRVADLSKIVVNNK